MKIKLFFVVFISLFAITSYSQTLINYGFEATSISSNSWASLSFSSSVWDLNANASYVKSGSKSAKFTSDGLGSGWLFSNSIAITSGKTYSVSLWYRTGSTADNLTLEIHLSPGQFLGATTQLLYTQSSISTTTFTELKFNFTATSTGNFNLALKGVSSPGSGILFVDDINMSVAVISAIEDISVKEKNNIQSIFPTVTEGPVYIQFKEGYTGSAAIIVYNSSGALIKKELYSISSNSAAKAINLSGLPAGIYYLHILADKSKKPFVQRIIKTGK